MKIAVIPGDGIGPEVIKQALKVLNTISKKYNCSFEFEEVLMGGIAIDKTGVPLPEETINICKNSDAVLLGAVGGEKWDTLPGHLRPEAGLLGIRKALGVFANLRPAILFPQLKSASTLKEEVLGDGLDIMVIRELIGGAYFGEKKRIETEEGPKAWDTMMYSAYEIERITHVAFKTAMKRKNKLTLVDKANVLESSRLWREIVFKIAKEYPQVQLNTMYVDNAAMQLIRNPRQFDLILTENLFGDILSDEASMLTGSLGMLPSASLGEGKRGLYEPIHGSAPDIAGQDKANPVATILSVAMMLRYSFDMDDAANDIESAVSKVLDEGYRTLDIYEAGTKVVGTEKMGDLIVEKI
ncbi:3-isopropylmalate dehydrogenase [Clostridium sp. USBA 49]|jgi:3-isopropylmalate dehydrogenase|uniref:3-isopropylmalate dehydrogenase n=1 Tax=Clostridium TaxID=1485 RepID=UPI000999B50E|nr:MULTISPECIES: 3-isopropylmalate dehydrogenase [Clostridium]SKA82449.1 3-isopropylmalate dehydrogenase [Clostridium sp. USBA 49]